MADNVVVVTISGPTGSGKSRVALEIEVALRAAGVAISYADHDDERQAHEEARAEAVGGYQPFLPGRVIIQEVNTPNSLPEVMRKVGY
jgi:pantothenate kinase-related protein Tda10